MSFQHPKRNRDGAAVVELAITLPVLFLILLATLEVTSMTFVKQSLKIAAYEASRVSLIKSAEPANVRAAAEEILSARKVKNFNVEISPADYINQPFGTAITVRVTADCNSNSMVMPLLFKNQQVHGQVTMMKEYE